MKREEKFLLNLEKGLSGLKDKDKNKIVLKYKTIIDDKKKSGVKVNDIFKELGNVKDICEIEISSLKKSKNVINKKIKDKKNSNIKNAAHEAKVEFNDKIENIKKSLLSDEKLSYKMILLTILIIFTSIIFIINMMCVFAFLDGVRLYGLLFTVFGFFFAGLWLCLTLYFNMINHKTKKYFNLIMLVTSLVIFCFGIALTIRGIYKTEHIYNVSQKYSFTNKIENYSLPSGDKKLYINYNSEYKVKYVFDYDENIDSSIKIETKYYECYYDYYSNRSGNNIYISLRKDRKGRLSSYIEDLKDNKVYDNKELSRYTVRIIINPNDKDRVVIY